jgi:hypothetical protein
MLPITGIKPISIHHADLFRSCHLFEESARDDQAHAKPAIVVNTAKLYLPAVTEPIVASKPAAKPKTIRDTKLTSQNVFRPIRPSKLVRSFTNQKSVPTDDADLFMVSFDEEVNALKNVQPE